MAETIAAAVAPEREAALDEDAQNKQYWLRRHQDMRGDIRAVGNKGKSIDENRAGYERKGTQLARILAEEGVLSAGDTALDLGCGTALLAPAVVAAGFSYTGVDVSPVALEQARETCPDGTFIESDLLTFVPPCKYVVVLVADVLCHLVSDTAWKAAIALVGSALAPDGIAVVFDQIRDTRVTYKDYVLQRSWDEYRAAFADAGLTIAPSASGANSYLVRHAEPVEVAAPPAPREAAGAGDGPAATNNDPADEPTAVTTAPSIHGAEATTPEAVQAVVAGYPHSPHERGVVLYEFIRAHNLRHVLELGFNHGVSTCYAAAALASLGGGHIVTVDRQQSAAYDPGLEQFLARLGLSRYVTPFYETSSYNWRLRDFLRRQPTPVFDLVFLDGGHLFEPDALAFLLAEKLLRPGGWFIFDDINWSMASSPTASPDPLRFAPDEIESRQVREIVDLLVRPHPHIAAWSEDQKWGFARKKTEEEMGAGDAFRRAVLADARNSRRRALEAFPRPIPIARDLKLPDWQKAVSRGLKENAQMRANAKD